MIRSAAVHQYKGRIFVQGYSKTNVGLRVLNGTVFMANESDCITIGQALLNALDQCEMNIKDPEESKDPLYKDEMLEATKCKTWNALMKSSKRMSVYEKEDKTINLLPLRFRGATGPNRGYDFLEDKAIISSTDPEELGRNVIKALELCE